MCVLVIVVPLIGVPAAPGCPACGSVRTGCAGADPVGCRSGRACRCPVCVRGRRQVPVISCRQRDRREIPVRPVHAGMQRAHPGMVLQLCRITSRLTCHGAGLEAAAGMKLRTGSTRAQPVRARTDGGPSGRGIWKTVKPWAILGPPGRRKVQCRTRATFPAIRHPAFDNKQ